MDELWVLLDDKFPYSQPRVLSPALREDSCNWPHIEDAGLLCLPSTGLRDCPGLRVLRHLEDALQLLNLEEADRKRDFQSEFATYWARGDVGKPLPSHWSLATPVGPSREVFRYHSVEANRYIWADTKPELEHWLRKCGPKSEQEVYRGCVGGLATRSPYSCSVPKAWVPCTSAHPVRSEGATDPSWREAADSHGRTHGERSGLGRSHS
ncbi:MAG: hypothetical protein IPF49_18250 [Gammaproteobacteria bacterium]|nr:hypothetical protein [Gammaproteobacteria bacterium]